MVWCCPCGGKNDEHTAQARYPGDIAAETGYTINTVSHALKEKPDIAPATRRQIQQVAARLGYVRNDMACALRSGRSHTIAVIAGAITNPFYAVMIDALYRCAQKMGYTQLVMCSDDGAEKEAQAVATAVGRQVDGVLLCSCGDSTRSVAMLRQAGVPVKVAVFRDDALGMIEHIQRGQYGGRLFASALPAQPDLGLLAQSFGLPFFRATCNAELRGALAGWLGADGPALLEIRV